jgi:CHAT domain-containing protein
MEAQGRYIDALTQSENPEIQKKFEELNNTRREMAKLQLSKPEEMSPEDYRKRLEQLEKKKESLETELSRLSKDFALEKMVGRADAKRIAEILLKKDKDSVYIDFANIAIYDFKEKKWGKSRYLVFMLLPAHEPIVKLIDISDTEEVDKHIRAYLEEMKRAKEYRVLPQERVLKAEAKALYEMLLKPIEADIKGKKHLYISPDGNLNLIPFEVLMTPEGKYLMEDYNITYIAAGRDIIRFADTNVAKGEPLIIADPDYDMGLQEKTRVAKTMGIIETRGPSPLTRDAKDLRFKRLPDTKQEANSIEKVVREIYRTGVRNYQDRNALEEILFTAKSPRILHLATHGYFLKDEETKKQPQMMGFISPERDRFVDIGIENPMLRSGIVLAGVNASLKEGKDDGLVSAEKILGLRLKGTDLVVLSACDTGTGEVKSGEGVFGLKRSFILSGAKTVVMSLWSIPSKETTELMTEFYTLMAKGKTKAEALREARLNLMKKKPNPFYWGAFVMVGNPN